MDLGASAEARAVASRAESGAVEWLRDEAPERPPALDEILSYHLQEAIARRTLGIRDAHHDALAAQACEYLAVAGLAQPWSRPVLPLRTPLPAALSRSSVW